jgi:hypothetical protein
MPPDKTLIPSLALDRLATALTNHPEYRRAIKQTTQHVADMLAHISAWTTGDETLPDGTHRLGAVMATAAILCQQDPEHDDRDIPSWFGPPGIEHMVYEIRAKGRWARQSTLLEQHRDPLLAVRRLDQLAPHWPGFSLTVTGVPYEHS